MQISICLEKGLGEKLDKLAKYTKRTKSFYVNEAVKRFLSQMDAYFQEIENIKTMQSNPNPEFCQVDQIGEKLGIKFL